MITTNENYDLEEIIPKLKAYTHRKGSGEGHLQREICASR